VPVLSLLASHTFSFVWHYLYDGEYRRWLVEEEFARPTGRLVALHACVLCGAWLTERAGGTTVALLVLVAVKTIFDLVVHVISHLGKIGRRRRLVGEASRLLESLMQAHRGDPLRERFPGYDRDLDAENRRRRTLRVLLATWGVCAAAAIGLAIWWAVIIGAGIWFLAVGFGTAAVLLYHRDRMRCRRCGQAMETLDLPLPLADAAREAPLEDRTLDVPGLWQRWYVCHGCGRYFCGRSYSVGYKPEPIEKMSGFA
jgi:hypothetical protein